MAHPRSAKNIIGRVRTLKKIVAESEELLATRAVLTAISG